MRISLLLLALGAILFMAIPSQRAENIPAWQTYCAVPQRNAGEPGIISVERVGRASPDIRSGHLFVHDGRLRTWDVANGDQFRGRDMKQAQPVPCPGFSAYGWSFTYGDGQATACKAGTCTSIAVRDRTLAFSYAAHDGAVFVGTSFGDALLFRDGQWCRMVRQGDEWACPDEAAPPPTKPSNQFYSSAIYEGRTLVGEYPTGNLFEFDGRRVFPSGIPRPVEGYALEAQTLMPFCGSLLVGYWPTGTIHRWDGKRWHEPISLFNVPADYPQFSDHAEGAGLVANFFGRRVPSLVPHDGELYAISGSKGDWNAQIDSGLPPSVFSEYGVVWRLSCSNQSGVVRASYSDGSRVEPDAFSIAPADRPLI